MLRILLFSLLALLPLAVAERPNVVLIVSDDHAWTDYGFMGHPHIQTPHLDRLAAQSLTFPHAYVPSSLCCPSLASIITGKYPRQHRVTSNDPPMPEGMTRAAFYKSTAFTEGREVYNRYMDAEPTLPRVLAAQGWLALQTGKWWQGDFRRGGFTHGMTKGGRHGDAGLEIGRKTMQPIYDFIAEAKRVQKPFFVWYAPLLPHDPHTPPERLLAKYRDKTPSLHIARYWAMVEWFDESIGALLAHLDAQGMAENTIIAYVTDNGWIQSADKPSYAPRSKQSPYDGGLRTPMMLRWPGKITPGRVETSVSSLDLYPTLLKACGIQVPAGLPGVDLRDAAAVQARKAVFGECYNHHSLDLAKPAASLRWRWVIEGGWKLIVPHAPNETGEPELYHLAEDPHEAHNRFAAEPERAQRLRAVLDAEWKP